MRIVKKGAELSISCKSMEQFLGYARRKKIYTDKQTDQSKKGRRAKHHANCFETKTGPPVGKLSFAIKISCKSSEQFLGYARRKKIYTDRQTDQSTGRPSHETKFVPLCLKTKRVA